MSLTPKDIVNGIIALDAIFIGLLGALLFFEPNLDLWTLTFVALAIMCFFLAINSIFVDLFIFKERDIPRDVTGLSFIGFLLTAIALASFCFLKYPDSSTVAWMFLVVPIGTALGVIVFFYGLKGILHQRTVSRSFEYVNFIILNGKTNNGEKRDNLHNFNL